MSAETFDETLTWKRVTMRVTISPHVWEIAAYSVFCVFRVYQLPNGTCWFRCDLVSPKTSGLRDAALPGPIIAHVQRHIPLELPVEVAPANTVSAIRQEATPLETVQTTAQRRHTKLLKVLAEYKALHPEGEVP